MTRDSEQHRGLWDLAVLCLLREHPMHPYEMQRLLKERHKDEVLVLKKGSLYHAINRLLDSELIRAIKTSREGRRPERTTYRITPGGEQAMVRWLQEIVATPVREPSAFMASMSFLVYLTPTDAAAQLERRAATLACEIAALETAMKSLSTWLDRIHRVEEEYLIAMRKAELTWVRNLLDDVRSGALTWDLKKILEALQTAKEASAAQAKRGTRK